MLRHLTFLCFICIQCHESWHCVFRTCCLTFMPFEEQIFEWDKKRNTKFTSCCNVKDIFFLLLNSLSFKWVIWTSGTMLLLELLRATSHIPIEFWFLSLTLDFIIALSKWNIQDIHQNQCVMPLICFPHNFLLKINSHLPKLHSTLCSNWYSCLLPSDGCYFFKSSPSGAKLRKQLILP